MQPSLEDHKAVYNTTCENVLDLSMQSKGEAKYEERQWEHLVGMKWVLIWALRKVWDLDWVSSHTHRPPRLGMAWWDRWQVSREESPGPGVMNSGVHPTSAANGQSTLGVTSCVWSSVSLCYVTHWEEVQMNGGQHAVESEEPGRASEIQIAALWSPVTLNMLFHLPGLRFLICRSQQWPSRVTVSTEWEAQLAQCQSSTAGGGSGHIIKALLWVKWN